MKALAYFVAFWTFAAAFAFLVLLDALVGAAILCFRRPNVDAPPRHRWWV